MPVRYLLSRILTVIPVFFVVVTTVFFLIRFAPGGPFDSEREISPEIRQNLNAKYHLDESMFNQYLRYWGNILHGDLGPSFKHANQTVNELIAQALPVSLELGFYSLLWAILFGVGSGILATHKKNTFWDHIPMSLATLGVCLPTFIIGPTLALIFGLYLQWLPVAGWETWQNRILPSITLGTAYTAYLARLTRAGLIEMKSQEFIKTARAKGLSEWQILWKHCLRGGMLPVVSYLGPAIAGILTGALVTETIFQIPGLGRFFIESAANRDYTVVMGTALLYFLLIFICNFLVDITYLILDPKLRHE